MKSIHPIFRQASRGLSVQRLFLFNQEVCPCCSSPPSCSCGGVDGSLFTLTDEAYSGPAILLRRGAKRLDAPTFDVKADEYPAIDGGFFRFARVGIREIFLPLTITGSTRARMMALKRRFISSLDPKRGMVTLQSMEYTNVGNLMVAETPRVPTCYYVTGMEGGEGSDGGIHWAKYGLVLRAPHPYFQHPSRTYESFMTYGTMKPFIDRVGSSTGPCVRGRAGGAVAPSRRGGRDNPPCDDRHDRAGVAAHAARQAVLTRARPPGRHDDAAETAAVRRRVGATPKASSAASSATTTGCGSPTTGPG